MKIESAVISRVQDDLLTFWDLETLGMRDTETSVHDKFSNEIRFTGERYQVNLPCIQGQSPGPDGIHIVVWKEFAFELSPALADIYNSSLEQGYFPTQLKRAIVVPVPKLRPPKSVENNLRPSH